MNVNEEVILVHGLWYGPWSMRPLAARLRRLGYRARLFSYRTTAGTLAGHAGRLARFAAGSAPATCHFVGHSLGGLVILAMLQERATFFPGRIVLLGSPLQGSQVARSVMNQRGGSWMLGAAAPTLNNGFARIPHGVEVGMLAGSRPIGLGRLVGRTTVAGDGVVSLEEADSPELRDRLVLPVSHTGMLFSRDVSRKVACFLAEGHF